MNNCPKFAPLLIKFTRPPTGPQANDSPHPLENNSISLRSALVLCKSGLWIRIYFLWIQIQLFLVPDLAAFLMQIQIQLNKIFYLEPAPAPGKREHNFRIF